MMIHARASPKLIVTSVLRFIVQSSRHHSRARITRRAVAARYPQTTRRVTTNSTRAHSGNGFSR